MSSFGTVPLPFNEKATEISLQGLIKNLSEQHANTERSITSHDFGNLFQPDNFAVVPQQGHSVQAQRTADWLR